MSPDQKLAYCTLDVFTDREFEGNPLGVVLIPPTSQLSQSQKQLIAREFNYSETIFIHETTKNDGVYTIDIFIVDAELPFAGHPTIGAGVLLLNRDPDAKTVTLRTKAGDIPVHPSQTRLRTADYADGLSDALPVASIVKGMTFVLLELTSVDALERMQSLNQSVSVPESHLGEWKGFSGLYAFVRTDNGTIRTRMFEGSLEDPATGSAASTLCSWLAEGKEDGKWPFKLVQGVEIGRRSEIHVSVDVEGGKVKTVELAGGAVQVMEGRLNVPRV